MFVTVTDKVKISPLVRTPVKELDFPIQSSGLLPSSTIPKACKTVASPTDFTYS